MNQPEYFQPSVLPTSDGSSTLIHPVLGELYHSRHGAWTESQHIFIAYGLIPFLDQNLPSVRVFEMGFGSGLNAALTREIADQYRIPVMYTAIEAYPVKTEVVDEMEMPAQSPDQHVRWKELHQIPWDTERTLGTYFTFRKINGTFPAAFIPDPGQYNLIYYDAFAPAAQPELWSVAALEKCCDLLLPGGRWLSYCAKGQVRRNLREAGFEVEALPGPPGKREITRASKIVRKPFKNSAI